MPLRTVYYTEDRAPNRYSVAKGFRVTFLDWILGRRLASEEEQETRIGVLAGVPVLGLDGLSSSAYGPEAALTILLPVGALGLAYIRPLTLVILALLAILYFSYRQTIAAYPSGGGSYTVAKENLGIHAGLFAAAALMLDYVLNVAVGISAGVGALVSALPSLQPHILAICLLILVVVTLINLRGVRESGLAFGIPTYVFIFSLLAILVIGVFKAIHSGGHPAPVIHPPALPTSAAAVGLWLLLRAFASGCTAMTGVEAVSNGVNAFAEPTIQNAQRTLTAIVVTLGVLLAGIAYLCFAYHIGAMDQEKSGYQSIISQLLAAVVGRGIFYYIAIGSILTVLCLSANTSFAGFPRLCRLVAVDSFLPHFFANLGRRLVYSVGIMILALLSAALLIMFGGITDRLIPLFAVGAFLAFTLSQAGMVVHWRREAGTHATGSLAVNAIGAVATAAALAVILVAKFKEGAWVTVLLIPGMVYLFHRIRSHYDHVRDQISYPRPLDLSNLEPPVVLVPFSNWNIITARAMRFALRLSPDIIAVHVNTEQDDPDEVKKQWAEFVEVAIERANLAHPRLEFLTSPYRRLFTPLMHYIDQLKAEFPSRTVAVIVPELVEAHWYHYLLHNHHATTLKAALLLKGDHRTIVINVPWYLSDRNELPQEADRL